MHMLQSSKSSAMTLGLHYIQSDHSSGEDLAFSPVAAIDVGVLMLVLRACYMFIIFYNLYIMSLVKL